MAKPLVRSTSYQSRFEELMPLYDLRTREFLPGIPEVTLGDLIRRSETPEPIARCLFDQVMVIGTGPTSRIGYSYACLAAVRDRACVFLGHESGFRTGHRGESLDVEFVFRERDGRPSPDVHVITGAEVVEALGQGVDRPGTHFAAFLNLAQTHGEVDIWFPDVNQEIRCCRRGVGFFDRRRLRRVLEAWRAEAAASRAAESPLAPGKKPPEQMLHHRFGTIEDLYGELSWLAGRIDQGFSQELASQIVERVNRERPQIAAAFDAEWPIVYHGADGRLSLKVYYQEDSPRIRLQGPFTLITQMERRLERQRRQRS